MLKNLKEIVALAFESTEMIENFKLRESGYWKYPSTLTEMVASCLLTSKRYQVNVLWEGDVAQG